MQQLYEIREESTFWYIADSYAQALQKTGVAAII